MARIRTIKPEFPQSESMGRISRDARLLFIQLWTLCDDEGRTRAASRMLASLLFPYDEDAPKLIEGWLVELEREDCLVRYNIDGCTYLQIHKWLNHQKIDKPSRSKFPPFDESSRILANPRERSSGDQGSRIKDQGREGIKEISLPTEARPAADCADVQLVFDHWRETWAHPKSKLDDKRRRLIRARLKDYSADELREAIAGYRNSDFHNGVETGHTQDHIELFMRDSQHVDAGLKFARAGPRESKVTRINAENGRAWLQQEQALESERQRAIPDLDDGVRGNVYEGNFLKNQ